MRKLLILCLLMAGFRSWATADSTVYHFYDKDLKRDIYVKSPSNISFEEPPQKVLLLVLRAFNLEDDEQDKVYRLVKYSPNASESIWTSNKQGQKIQVIAVRKNEEDFTYESSDGSDTFDFTYSEPDQPRVITKNNYHYSRFFSPTDFAIYLGLNSYTGQQDIAPNNLSELQVWPSRYIALSFRANATLSNNKKTHWVLSYGPEFAWHNFMLLNNHVLKYEGGQVAFEQSDKATSKSKFVVPHVNLPVMLNIGFKRDHLRVGIGGYIGYRIGGYTKVEYKDGGGKEKNKGSLGLNDLKYGITAELGRSPGAALFIRYDLSEMFRSTQVVPNGMQAFSFGIRL